MVPITTVIITKNEAANIAACIQSAQTLSSDVIVVDCGSEDATVALAEQAGAKVTQIEWQCYGHSRNTGAAAAKHDWILSLDADERVSPALAEALHDLTLDQAACVYKIKRENYFAGKQLRFGTLGFESVTRLYNRKATQWDLVPVHEKLLDAEHCKKILQPIIHHGITSLQAHREKKEGYARLSAQKYLQQNRKAGVIKRFLSPAFNGIKSYVFQFGFLDGRKGWQIALTITRYTWLKYYFLHQLPQTATDKKAVSFRLNNAVTSVTNVFFAKR